MGLFPCRFNNHIVIIDSQWIMCTNTQLHAKALWRINFWSTDTEVLWAMDNLARWHFSAFSWQFTASRAITQFSINIAQHTQFAISSSIRSISMTYHKQFSQCSLLAPGLNAEWCSWLYEWMDHDGGYSSRFESRNDCSFSDSYVITKWNFVSNFHLKFRLRILTYP